jgi:hypothetical protein
VRSPSNGTFICFRDGEAKGGCATTQQQGTMTDSNGGNAKSEPVLTNGPSHLTELALTTPENPQETPPPFGDHTLSHGMPFSADDYLAQGTLNGGTENDAKKQPDPADASLIYVDYSVPAVLRYSETMAIYLTLREAIAAWLALPNEIKKDALITTAENGGDSRYRGWEIYRLWGHWNP